MEPRGIDLPASRADIHLEADIYATKGNPNGFGAGEWMPYLTVTYRLENKDTGKVLTGNLMPMVAVDGPHYGSNIKMPGPGNVDELFIASTRYKVTFFPTAYIIDRKGVIREGLFGEVQQSTLEEKIALLL